MIYFADTYALIEFFKGHLVYKRYLSENEIITSKMNLMEMYYSILTQQNRATAENCYQSVLQYVHEITDEDIKSACHFREKNRHKEVSYIDALGYSMAQNRHVKFLTGDNAFKEIENVEWVK